LGRWPALAGDSSADACRFVGLHRFDDFKIEAESATERTLISPTIRAPIAWNELVVSWNTVMPSNSWLKLEARGVYTNSETKYYALAQWSADAPDHPRESFPRQADADGEVRADTWLLKRSGAGVQLRVSLGRTNGGALPELKFMGLSFLDTQLQPDPPKSEHRAWGRIIATPERSQLAYPQEKGWCSPASLSMVLSRWGEVLQRPELKLDVPEVAAGVYDPEFGGTGNWAFNAAFAGGFPGMRAYVARFSDLAEVEDWIEAGIPVVLSAPWNLLNPGRNGSGLGHLVVCIGFTETGDVVINDPATNLQKGQKVRHFYPRENVIKAWKHSHNTVYLVYPEGARIPADPLGHWD
jgi:hypothetical protein